MIQLTKGGAVLEDKEDVVTKEGDEADGEHYRHEEHEQDVELARHMQLIL